MGKISVDTTDRIMTKDRFKCSYCDFEANDFNQWMQLTIDHIMPVNSGGKDDEENLTTCCSNCNSITSRMKFDEGGLKDYILKRKKDAVIKHHDDEIKQRWERLKSAKNKA